MVKETGILWKFRRKDMITMFKYIKDCHTEDKLHCFLWLQQIEYKSVVKHTRKKYLGQYKT